MTSRTIWAVSDEKGPYVFFSNEKAAQRCADSLQEHYENIWPTLFSVRSYPLWISAEDAVAAITSGAS